MSDELEHTIDIRKRADGELLEYLVMQYARHEVELTKHHKLIAALDARLRTHEQVAGFGNGFGPTKEKETPNES